MSSTKSWVMLTKESYSSAFPQDTVIGRFPDYSQCCKLVRHLAGRVTVLCAGTVESMGRCISTVTSYSLEGQEKLSITTAVICLPGASKDLEKTIQAVQRGTSCNAEATREMGIDKIDFGGLAQDWHGVQAYVPFMEALHTQWTDSSHEPSLQKRTLDLISVPIHPSLDFLTQFGSGKKKRPWGQLRLAYKPVVKKNGQHCALRDKAFSGDVPSQPVPPPESVQLSKWTILKAIYRLQQQSKDGFVHAKALKQHYPEMMLLLTDKLHGNTMYGLTRSTVTMPAYMELIDHKSTYRLADDGISKAEELLRTEA